MPVLDAGGAALSAADGARKVDKDRRALEKAARDRRVVNVLVQVAAVEQASGGWEGFTSILRRYRARKKFTPKEALAVLKRAYTRKIPYRAYDFDIDLRKDKSQADLGKLQPFDLKIIWECLRPDQRAKVGEYQGRVK